MDKKQNVLSNVVLLCGIINNWVQDKVYHIIYLCTKLQCNSTSELPKNETEQ